MNIMSSLETESRKSSVEQVNKKRLGVLIGGSGLIGGTLAHYFKTKTAEEIEIRAPSSKKLSIRDAGLVDLLIGPFDPYILDLIA